MSPGGSASLRPRRVVKSRQTKHEKNQAAIGRAIAKVGGIEILRQIQETWSSLKVENFGEDQENGNGIIMNLLNLNLSQIEIH